MKNRFLKTVIFTAAIIFSLNSQAQDRKKGQKGGQRGGGSPEKMIERLDVDKDGKLNLEEVSAAKRGKLAESFEAIDIDADGLLDITELETYFEERKGKKKNKKKNKKS